MLALSLSSLVTVLAVSANAQSSGSAVASGSSVAPSASAVASANGTSSSSVSSNSTTSSTNATLSPYIPTTLSAGCTTYLTALNSDPVLADCVTPLLTATTQAANSNSSSTLTKSLTSLCSTTACSDTTIRTQLSKFYSACSVELNGADGEYDETVREIYDLLYVVQPLREVVCTKDNSTEAFCVMSLSTALGASNTTATSIALSSPSSSAAANGTASNITLLSNNVVLSPTSPEAFAAAHLSITFGKRSIGHQLQARASASDSSSTTTTYPNSTTYKTTNLPYLFLQPTSPLAALCSSCAKAVFTAYAQWEYRTPYALGLSASPILGGQAALWKGAQSTCGSVWVGAIQTEAIGSEAAAAAVGGSASTDGTSGGERESRLVGAVAMVGAVVAGVSFLL